MRQGAARHALAERGGDFYETPVCATQALLRCNEPVLYPWPTEGCKPTLWEPAAGRGAIIRELRSRGWSVVAQDLVNYDSDQTILSPIDFLLQQNPPPGVAAIVTNPPYKLANEFIRHGLSFGLPVIVLLRLMAIEGAGRSDLIDKHCWRIWAGTERLPMMHRDGWDGPRISSSGAPFAWFAFEPKVRPSGQAIELRRISWRAA